MKKLTAHELKELIVNEGLMFIDTFRGEYVKNISITEFDSGRVYISEYGADFGFWSDIFDGFENDVRIIIEDSTLSIKRKGIKQPISTFTIVKAVKF